MLLSKQLDLQARHLQRIREMDQKMVLLLLFASQMLLYPFLTRDLTSFAKDGTGGVQMYLRKVMVLQLFYPSREYI
nr:hypothetical protein Iba_chr03bCG16100 [Ipomoea batatas]GMC77296.1 hypothetical protein Iba_chr03eCG9320 [Ipomoea batatas]